MGTSKIGPVVTVHDSIGSWVACEKCAKLFEAGDHDQLARRGAANTVASSPKKHRAAVQVMAEELARSLHIKFRETWSGKRRRIGFE
jgi:hypothetical protein